MTWLCLVRHGLAGSAGPKWPDDSQRPLTPRGRIATAEAAAGLATLVRADVVLTSPFVRALQTAELVASAMGCSDLRTTDALIKPDQAGLLAEIARTGAETVAAVGHEPDMSRSLSFALTGDPDGIQVWMKKSAAAALYFEGTPRGGAGQLQWFLPPRALRGLAQAAR